MRPELKSEDIKCCCLFWAIAQLKGQRLMKSRNGGIVTNKGKPMTLEEESVPVSVLQS
jgi:hypothetical protein